MDLRTILISILLSLIPISELRGGLPYALISGIPLLPAYTGALGAWVLGMKKRKSLLVLAAGVIIAGIIVSAVYLIGITALYIFIK